MKTQCFSFGLGVTAIALFVMPLVIAIGGSSLAASPPIYLQTFSASGAGAGFKTPVSTGCPTGDTCYSLSGPVVGTPIGRGSFTVVVNTITLPNVPNNGSGGTCTPTSGVMTITCNLGATITLGFVGDFCDVGGPPPSPAVGPVTFNGSFFVTGGSGGSFGLLNGKSGRGDGGSGTGTLTLSGDSDDGEVLLSLSGILEVSP